MTGNCAATCSFCTTTTATTTTTTKPCTDNHEDCQDYKKGGYCLAGSTYYNWMRDHCAASCCFKPCQTKPDNQDCESYEKGGYCQTDSKYYKWMSDHCATTCTICTWF